MKNSHMQKKHKKQKKLHKQAKKDGIFLCAHKTSKKENTQANICLVSKKSRLFSCLLFMLLKSI